MYESMYEDSTVLFDFTEQNRSGTTGQKWQNAFDAGKKSPA